MTSLLVDREMPAWLAHDYLALDALPEIPDWLLEAPGSVEEPRCDCGREVLCSSTKTSTSAAKSASVTADASPKAATSSPAIRLLERRVLWEELDALHV